MSNRICYLNFPYYKIQLKLLRRINQKRINKKNNNHNTTTPSIHPSLIYLFSFNKIRVPKCIQIPNQLTLSTAKLQFTHQIHTNHQSYIYKKNTQQISSNFYIPISIYCFLLYIVLLLLFQKFTIIQIALFLFYKYYQSTIQLIYGHVSVVVINFILYIAQQIQFFQIIIFSCSRHQLVLFY
ncbi:transmembrane protein, putative (macronuclear) [Tetrahymena thermophila SB210]|uniref:Transmembrane protein, putative n=1 Tax=Tetrahymena thermophila (strain SB210) TaxID=312017 RepID=W7X7C2_TETTS|nr:transmembrane protein, putative [Tetrahymena thermophila SB210]EWS72283.1 transmembrane protein, putative [Tetrahymena thermophila SB210]|eukprot:XP_012655223.1 transmembrane protein, putative [Tetrahymena thermophila SB210]